MKKNMKKINNTVNTINNQYKDAQHNQVIAKLAYKKYAGDDEQVKAEAPRLGDDSLSMISTKRLSQNKRSLCLKGIRYMTQNLLDDLHDMIPTSLGRLREYEHMERIFTRTARVMRDKDGVEQACKAMFILNRDIFNVEMVYSLVDVIDDKYLLDELGDDAEWAYYILKMIEIRVSIEELVTII